MQNLVGIGIVVLNIRFSVLCDFGLKMPIYGSFRVESYQSDICRFIARTLSPLHSVVNWSVLTIFIKINSCILNRYHTAVQASRNEHAFHPC